VDIDPEYKLSDEINIKNTFVNGLLDETGEQFCRQQIRGQPRRAACGEPKCLLSQF